MLFFGARGVFPLAPAQLLGDAGSPVTFLCSIGGCCFGASSWASDAEDSLLSLQFLVVAVVDVPNRYLKVDLVELLF